MRTWLIGVVLWSVPLADAELPMGIAETDNGLSVRVWAPQARSVDLVGDFNGWKAQGSERLQREGDTGVWSTVLKRSLPKGGYRFTINGDLPRRDPYGRAVTADEKASLFYDTRAFNWEGDRAPVQSLDDLVIYELHVGAFHDPKPEDGRPGTFQDAIRRLDHLVDLGVNCVQLLPVHEFWGQHSWGYNPSDPFAVEQAYGGPDGLKTFVKECHRRGLAVHLDIVHNHYGPQNLDLLRFDGTGNATDGGPYFYDAPGMNMTPWGPRLRFDEARVRDYVRDNAFLWLDEYRVDGFRWDSTVNIRAYLDGQQALPAGQRMLDDINAAIRARFPGRLSIAEDSLGIGNFDASWDYDFHHSVVPVLRARNDRDRHMSQLASALGSRPSMWRVVYVDNHDEAGKINQQTRLASDVDPSDPGSDLSRRLCGLGAVFAFTAPGTPLLFFGNEMMESGTFHDDRPLDWSKRQRNAGMVALHRDLIRLRRNLDGAGGALKGLGFEAPVVDESAKLLVYWRWHEERPGERMVIAVNLSRQPMTAAVVPFPAAGPWTTRLNTDWSRYGGAGREEAAPFTFPSAPYRGRTALAPYSARIFTLDPSAAAAARATAAPEAVPESTGEPKTFSMYASLNVVGTFNDWNLTAWPMTRGKNLTWERRCTFRNVEDGALRISANDSGQVFWGASYDDLAALPYRTTLQRLGRDIKIRTRLDGDYLVRFNEETLELSIEPVPGPAAAPPPPPLRTWTDVRGKRIEARLVDLQGDRLTLERPDGQRISVRRGSLSAEDQEHLRAAP